MKNYPDVHPVAAEAYALAMINCNYDVEASLVGPVYRVSVFLYPELPSNMDWSEMGKSIIGISGPAAVSYFAGQETKFQYQKKQGKLVIEFPVPIREERFFPRNRRKEFLRDYGVHLVATVLCQELCRHGNMETCHNLQNAYPSPRHGKDIQREQFWSNLKRRWRDLCRGMKPGRKDSLRHYR